MSSQRDMMAITIDNSAKYKFSGASVTPKRKEPSIQGPTTILLLQREQQLPCVSHHRHLSPGDT